MPFSDCFFCFLSSINPQKIVVPVSNLVLACQISDEAQNKLGQLVQEIIVRPTDLYQKSQIQREFQCWNEFQKLLGVWNPGVQIIVTYFF